MWGYVQEQLVRSGDVHTVKAYKGGGKKGPKLGPRAGGLKGPGGQGGCAY